MELNLNMETEKLNIEQIQKKENDALKEFIIMIWMTNPKHENVKVILDDGQIKFSLKYDRFYQIMFDTLTDLIKDSSVMGTLNFIKNSLSTYGGIYYLNKSTNEYRQLTNTPGIEHLRPIDIMNTTVAQVQAEKESKMTLFEKSKQDSKLFFDKIFGQTFHLTGTTNYQKFYGHE